MILSLCRSLKCKISPYFSFDILGFYFMRIISYPWKGFKKNKMNSKWQGVLYTFGKGKGCWFCERERKGLSFGLATTTEGNVCIGRTVRPLGPPPPSPIFSRIPYQGRRGWFLILWLGRRGWGEEDGGKAPPVIGMA